MKRAMLVCLVVLAGPVAGQEARPPAQGGLPGLLMELRDGVDHVSASVSEFRRDLRTAGDPTVLARATRLASTCRDTRESLAAAPARLTATRLKPSPAAARDSLVTAIGILERVLRQECERGLGPTGPGSRADTLRAWGPHRTAAVSQAVSGYHSAAARLARRIGVDLTRH